MNLDPPRKHKIIITLRNYYFLEIIIFLDVYFSWRNPVEIYSFPCVFTGNTHILLFGNYFYLGELFLSWNYFYLGIWEQHKKIIRPKTRKLFSFSDCNLGIWRKQIKIKIGERAPLHAHLTCMDRVQHVF